MRHVDEGTIHAWLDEQITDPAEAAWIDEHLRGCGECRARLAEERATFDRAQVLLAGTAPSGERPSFDTLVAKAGRGASASEAMSVAALTRGRKERWLIQAGWAASVAIAVGLGWTARELTDRDTVNLAQAPVIAEPSAVTGEPPARPVEAAQPVAPPVTGAQASRQRAAAAPRPAAPEKSVESAVPAPRLEASAPVAEKARAAAPPAAAPPVSVPPLTAQAVAVQPRAAGLLQEAVTITGVSAAPEAARVDTDWRALPRTEAAARTGMPLYGIDGVEPLVTALSADGALVRTMYRLASGETVELLQERTVPGLVDVQSVRRGLTGSGGGTGAVLGRVTPPARTLSTVRGDVRITLRTSSEGTDLDSLGTRLRID